MCLVVLCMNIGGCEAAHNYYVISMVLCGYFDIELVLGGFTVLFLVMIAIGVVGVRCNQRE